MNLFVLCVGTCDVTYCWYRSCKLSSFEIVLCKYVYFGNVWVRLSEDDFISLRIKLHDWSSLVYRVLGGFAAQKHCLSRIYWNISLLLYCPLLVKVSCLHIFTDIKNHKCEVGQTIFIRGHGYRYKTLFLV